MNALEQGFALLTCHLGDPEQKPLTVAQFRNLAKRIAGRQAPEDIRELETGDLVALGYGRGEAERILRLLDRQAQLHWYCQKGKQVGCEPITRLSQIYPQSLRVRLGLEAPACLWAKGDMTLLTRPAISLVGSRTLDPLNGQFAQEVGRQAALQGYVLISGNARGADTLAQESCLAHGGQVISVVADALQECADRDGLLYLSEEGFELPFSAYRALSRNRLIHAMPQLTLVAQAHLDRGGSWDGTVKNLKNHWSPVFVLDDGSQAANALQMYGAEPVIGSQLTDFSALRSYARSFFDQ